MDMNRTLTIVMGQIEKHRKIHDAAMELGERKMAMDHSEIAEALEAVLEAVK